MRDTNEPLAPELASKIEVKHLEVFCGQRQPTLPVDINTGGRKPGEVVLLRTWGTLAYCPVLATVNNHDNKVEVRWHSVVDVAVYSTSVGATLWAFVPLVKSALLCKSALIRSTTSFRVHTAASRLLQSGAGDRRRSCYRSSALCHSWRWSEMAQVQADATHY